MLIPETEITNIKNILKNDGVIAFPTDTVWGMGCLVENKTAVEKIYRMKSREQTKPLILLSSRLEYLLPYVEELPDVAIKLAEKHLPGALTIVVKKSILTPDYITSGFNTVGIRIPDHPVYLELVERAVDTHVLATTSANISGMGAVARKEDVIDTDYVVDDYGIPAKGVESTVITVDEHNNVKMLRKGAITELML